jgi:membrane fusion protein, multidrug efflux system
MIIVVLLSFTGCERETETHSPIAIPVKTIKMAEAVIGQEHNYVGIIEESYSTMQSFGIGGNVMNVYVSEGEHVQKGQLMAKLDPVTVQSSYNAAKATLEKATDGYKRAEQLYKNGSLAEVKWVEIQTALEQAQSMADIAKKNLQDCNLYASFSGVVGEKHIEPGMNILPYQQAIKLMKIDRLKVKVAIPENEISATALGEEAKIEVSALPNSTFTGKISERGVNADPLSHCYTIKIDIDNQAKELMPGMVCKVYIKSSGNPESGFQVPTNAIQISNNNERFVWVVENNLAKRHLVKIGDLAGNNVMITSGLSRGDHVIVEGSQKIGEDTKVCEQ